MNEEHRKWRIMAVPGRQKELKGKYLGLAFVTSIQRHYSASEWEYIGVRLSSPV